MQPIVSVIMPAFNVEAYIAESMNSVLKQTFQEFELIVINDGSTDTTEAVITAFQLMDPRIVYYKQLNRGVASSRNQGLILARGSLIAFLDADDLWDPFFLEKVVATQKMVRADCVFSENDWLLADGRRIRYSERLTNEAAQIPGNVLMLLLQKRVSIHLCAILIRKEFLFDKQILFTEGCIMGEDTEFKYKVFSNARVGHIAEVLMTYRQRKDSLTQRAWNWRTYVHSVQAFERAIDYIKRNYTGNNRAAIVTECQKSLNFKVYRFLYLMLRNGNFSELLRMMQLDCWGGRFNHFKIWEYGIIHMLKIQLLLTKQVWLWKVFAGFGKVLAKRRRKELAG